MDTYLTFLLYILILTQLILMKVTHKDQILLLSHVPIFMIQPMFKIGKLAPLLTHLYYNSQSLNRIVELKTIFRLLQTLLKTIVPNKYPNQTRTLKLHMNPCHNNYRSRVTTLQRWRSMILLPKCFRKTNLVILDAANTTYALIPILITQNYTNIDVCKIIFQPRLVRHSLYLFFLLSHTYLSIFLWGQIHTNTNHQQNQQYVNKQNIVIVLL